MTIEYRVVESIDELELVTNLEIDIWGMDARFAVPSSIMSAMLHHGGLINAAFDDEVMVGMAAAFPGYTHNRLYLWSHMAGVLPDYQGQGIGLKLKLEQREWALKMGYPEIRWTFDPLQRGNAHFNMVRLGAVSSTYYVDLYGTMEDGINAGMPSDRLEAVWKLEAASPAIPPPAPIDRAAVAPLLDIHDGRPTLHQPTAPAVSIAVPLSLTALRARDPALVLTLRLAMRQAFLSAFEAGYTLTNFYETDQTGYYILTRPTS